jgi:hypothetical protein
MKKLLKIIIITFVFLALAGAMAIASTAMVNDDVIKLVTAGMTEPLILSTIETSVTQFDTSADALIKLKKAGVTDTVIHRMLSKKAQPAKSGKTNECQLVTSEHVQAVMDGDKQINLGYREPDIDEDISPGSTIASFFTLGIAPEKGTVSARISGNRATNRLKSRLPVFPDLTANEGQSPEDAFTLVKLEIKGDSRFIIIGESSGSLFGGYQSHSKFREGTQIPMTLEIKQRGCTYKDAVLNVYRGVPSVPLAPGEYALLYGESFFDFGIDP